MTVTMTMKKLTFRPLSLSLFLALLSSCWLPTTEGSSSVVSSSRRHPTTIDSQLSKWTTAWRSGLRSASLIDGAAVNDNSVLNDKYRSMVKDKASLSPYRGRTNVNPDALRKLQTTNSSQCVDEPFLWLIRNDNRNGTVEGLGVGTLHLPRQFVTTDSEWTSLVNAVADGCTVYGELDVTDTAAIEQILLGCAVPYREPMLVSDIPDEALRTEMERLVLDIATEYTLFPIQITANLLTASMDTIFELISYWNSNVEFRDYFFVNAFNGVTDLGFLDSDLLDLGGESEGLETAEETCELIKSIQSPSKQQFLSSWNESYADIARYRLTASFDEIIDAYQCGQMDEFIEYFVPTLYESSWEDAEGYITTFLDGMCENIVPDIGWIDVLSSSRSPNSLLPPDLLRLLFVFSHVPVFSVIPPLIFSQTEMWQWLDG